MITLTDIARELGVSTATISNAMTGKGRMKDETRRAIREKALAMGYPLPQPTARRRESILVIAEDNHVTFSSEIVSGLSVSAREAKVPCSIIDLAITLGGPGRDASPEQLRPMIREALAMQESMPGCVVYVSQYPRQLTGLLDHLGCPAVAVFCYGSGAQVSINTDDQQGAYQAVSHLIDTGRRQIAMISGPVDNRVVSERMIGYQRALIDHGLIVHPKLMWIGDWEIASGRELTRSLLQTSHRPDAIFAQNDTMACGALQAVAEMGLRVPEDVAVVGFDNTAFCTWSLPELTSVAQPFFAMGRAAFEQAHLLLKDGVPAQDVMSMPCTLHVRGSSAAQES